jgi:hypothetical protein
VSRFHLIWCLVAQESKLGRKGSVFCATPVKVFNVTRPCPTGSGKITGRSGIFSSTFDNCLERNLLTVSPIDPIFSLDL